MDLTRTTDHIQSRPGLSNQNTTPRDLSQPITNLSEYKGAAQPRGRAKAADTLPPSLIARMAKNVLATQRRQLASQPASSRDTRIAEHYEASYVLEERGGVTAPGAELSLRPTGKAAGGMNPAQLSTTQIQNEMRELRGSISEARQQYQENHQAAQSATSANMRRAYNEAAEASLNWQRGCERRYDSLATELDVRSGRRSRF